MRILMAVTIGLLGLSPAAGAERVVAPKVSLKSLDQALEAAASEFGLATEISGRGCERTHPATCIFVGEGRVEIRGTADTVESPPTKIMLLYKDYGLSWPLPLNMGLLVSIVEPAMDRDDRYVLTLRILDLAGQRPSNDPIYGQNARFIIDEVADQIVITAEPAQ
jgi:hypothetical protein